MSGFVCPKCKVYQVLCHKLLNLIETTLARFIKIIYLFQNESQIFPATTGGAQKMCQELNIPLLGKLPLDPRIGSTS